MSPFNGKIVILMLVQCSEMRYFATSKERSTLGIRNPLQMMMAFIIHDLISLELDGLTVG